MPRAKKTSWTVSDLHDLNQRQQGRLSGALQALGLEERLDRKAATLSKPAKKAVSKSASKTGATPSGEGGGERGKENSPNHSTSASKTKAKRQGVSTQPIYTSLDLALPQAQWGMDWLAIQIPGGRVLTYNELFSILQFRKYEAFRYKKICRNVIKRALAAPGSSKPFFNGPTRLTLIRVGKKEMDRDALPIVFKYFLDSLKIEGVIDDDNPNIIVDIVTHQSAGEPWLALRLDRLPQWEAPKVPSWEELTSDIPSSATQPNKRKKTTR